MKQVMIAAPSSGVGKTTVTLGLLQALKNQGYRVQPYKVGPDYIDSAYHSRICQRVSRNLDQFMIDDPTRLSYLYQKQLDGVDVALVEGVMGLFDGLGTDKDFASSASIAKILKLPVVLVIDGKATSTSAAALVHGFSTFDSDLDLVGVIVNRVGSQMHFELIKGAIERYTEIPVLGYLTKNQELVLPSRHLGLIPDLELDAIDQQLAYFGQEIEKTVDLNRLLDVIERPLTKASFSLPSTEKSALRIGYALDSAFHFYYEDNLELLREKGVALIPFSPLADKELPPADAYYFGGGFPEIFAEELEANYSFRKSVFRAHVQGIPIYGECGGLMYLGKDLEKDGQKFEMVGIFDGSSRMTQRLQRFGYCQAKTLESSLFGPVGTLLKGHEFHHSTFETNEPTVLNLEKYRDGQQVAAWSGGYQKGHTFASYLHLHFYQQPEMVDSWLDWIGEVHASN